jgi:MFS family permease
MSAVQAGLHMLPMATMMAFGAVVSSRILARRGPRLPMLAAGVGLAAGGLLLSRLTASSAPAPLALAFIVFGIGGGLVNAPITYTAVSGMPVSQAGVASGIASTSRQMGQCLGIAVTGSILAGNLRGGPLRAGFVTASHADWLLLTACGVVVFVLGLVTTSQWALDTAARTAATFDQPEPRVPSPLRLLPGDLPQGR